MLAVAVTHADVRRAEVEIACYVYMSPPQPIPQLEAYVRMLSMTNCHRHSSITRTNYWKAIAQKNILYQSAAIYAHIIYYYNLLDQKRAEQWLRRLEQLSEEHNYYRHYFRGKKMMIECYIISQKIELALKQAQDMYDKAQSLGNHDGMREACLCLMTGYFNTLRYKEGITYLNKAFELTNPDSSLATQIDLLTKAVLAYSYLHDNGNMFRYLEELNNAKNRLQEEGTTVLTNGYTNLYLLAFTIRPSLLCPPSTACGSMGIFAAIRTASQYIFISSLSVDTFGSICRILPTDKRIRQSVGLFRRRH